MYQDQEHGLEDIALGLQQHGYTGQGQSAVCVGSIRAVVSAGESYLCQCHWHVAASHMESIAWHT